MANLRDAVPTVQQITLPTLLNDFRLNIDYSPTFTLVAHLILIRPRASQEILMMNFPKRKYEEQ